MFRFIFLNIYDIMLQEWSGYMTINSVLVIFQKIIDISLVWLVFYYLLKNLRNNVKMVLLFKGILFLFIIKIVSDFLNLTTIGLRLEYVMM